MLEGELKSELDFPRSGIPVEASETARGALAEVRVSYVVLESQIGRLQTSEVHAVEEIKDLSPELNAVTFLNLPVLIDREINVLAGRHSYRSATETPKTTRSRQTECGRVEIVDPVIEVDRYARNKIWSLC